MVEFVQSGEEWSGGLAARSTASFTNGREAHFGQTQVCRPDCIFQTSQALVDIRKARLITRREIALPCHLSPCASFCAKWFPQFLQPSTPVYVVRLWTNTTLQFHSVESTPQSSELSDEVYRWLGWKDRFPLPFLLLGILFHCARPPIAHRR